MTDKQRALEALQALPDDASAEDLIEMRSTCAANAPTGITATPSSRT